MHQARLNPMELCSKSCLNPHFWISAFFLRTTLLLITAAAFNFLLQGFRFAHEKIKVQSASLKTALCKQRIVSKYVMAERVLQCSLHPQEEENPILVQSRLPTRTRKDVVTTQVGFCIKMYSFVSTV